MQSAVCHYTVGRDSTGVGKRGYFQFLVSRTGIIQQFAEADAVCWHGGDPWNGRGPGIEIEYHPDYDTAIFTAPQRDATQALCSWLTSEWGIPANFYDGPRRNDWAGFITHRSLVQTGDAHSDYWPAADAAVIFAPPAPLPPAGDNMAAINYKGQLTTFRVNTLGTLVETYYNGTAWVTLNLAGPGANVPVHTTQPARQDVAVDVLWGWNAPDRLDVFAPATNGGLIHAWYNGNGTFASELL